MKKSGSRRPVRSPLRKSLLTAGGLILGYFILFLFRGINYTTVGPAMLDALVCVFGFFFWTFFFAQFVLPLKKARERRESFDRLISYLSGLVGPVIRVEDGDVRQRKGESDRNGPGVILMDTASAGLVRNPGEFVGSVGPGVSFTRAFESLSGVVDLHLQRATLGPEEQEDPFAGQQPEESEAFYKARQARRFATQGLTRNGIPIVPRISVAIRLDCEQRRGNTHFGYDPNAVYRAITGRPVDLSASQDSPNRPVEMTWLPLRLAADIWKECISRYTLEELFAFEPGQDTALQKIQQEMRIRLTKNSYEEMDRFGKPVGAARRSKEYIMLRDKGVRVIGVSISYLKLPDKVEERLIEIWKSTWLIRARMESEFVEQQRSYETEQGKRSAMGTYAGGLTHFLGAQNPSVPMTGEQILRFLLRGSLYTINQHGYVHRSAADEIDQIKEMLDWSEQRGDKP